jgi:hypothetical protein
MFDAVSHDLPRQAEATCQVTNLRIVQTKNGSRKMGNWAFYLSTHIFRQPFFLCHYAWQAHEHVSLGKKHSLERQFVLLAHSGCCWLISVFMSLGGRNESVPEWWI